MGRDKPRLVVRPPPAPDPEAEARRAAFIAGVPAAAPAERPQALASPPLERPQALVSVPEPPQAPAAAPASSVSSVAPGEGPPARAAPGARARAEYGSAVLIERKGGRKTRRMTVYLPPELAEQLTRWCRAQGREVSHAIAEALSRYLAEGGAPRPRRRAAEPPAP
jgi:hypothetical protein